MSERAGWAMAAAGATVFALAWIAFGVTCFVYGVTITEGVLRLWL